MEGWAYGNGQPANDYQSQFMATVQSQQYDGVFRVPTQQDLSSRQVQSQSPQGYGSSLPMAVSTSSGQIGSPSTSLPGSVPPYSSASVSSMAGLSYPSPSPTYPGQHSQQGLNAQDPFSIRHQQAPVRHPSIPHGYGHGMSFQRQNSMTPPNINPSSPAGQETMAWMASPRRSPQLSPASVPGMQHPASVPGMQHPVNVPGMQQPMASNPSRSPTMVSHPSRSPTQSSPTTFYSTTTAHIPTPPSLIRYNQLEGHATFNNPTIYGGHIIANGSQVQGQQSLTVSQRQPNPHSIVSQRQPSSQSFNVSQRLPTPQSTNVSQHLPTTQSIIISQNPYQVRTINNQGNISNIHVAVSSAQGSIDDLHKTYLANLSPILKSTANKNTASSTSQMSQQHTSHPQLAAISRMSYPLSGATTQTHNGLPPGEISRRYPESSHKPPLNSQGHQISSAQPKPPPAHMQRPESHQRSLLTQPQNMTTILRGQSSPAQRGNASSQNHVAIHQQSQRIMGPRGPVPVQGTNHPSQRGAPRMSTIPAQDLTRTLTNEAHSPTIRGGTIITVRGAARGRGRPRGGRGRGTYLSSVGRGQIISTTPPTDNAEPLQWYRRPDANHPSPYKSDVEAMREAFGHESERTNVQGKQIVSVPVRTTSSNQGPVKQTISKGVSKLDALAAIQIKQEMMENLSMTKKGNSNNENNVIVSNSSVSRVQTNTSSTSQQPAQMKIVQSNEPTKESQISSIHPQSNIQIKKEIHEQNNHPATNILSQNQTSSQQNLSGRLPQNSLSLQGQLNNIPTYPQHVVKTNNNAVGFNPPPGSYPSPHSGAPRGPLQLATMNPYPSNHFVRNPQSQHAGPLHGHQVQTHQLPSVGPPNVTIAHPQVQTQQPPYRNIPHQGAMPQQKQSSRDHVLSMWQAGQVVGRAPSRGRGSRGGGRGSRGGGRGSRGGGRGRGGARGRGQGGQGRGAVAPPMMAPSAGRGSAQPIHQSNMNPSLVNTSVPSSVTSNASQGQLATHPSHGFNRTHIPQGIDGRIAVQAPSRVNVKQEVDGSSLSGSQILTNLLLTDSGYQKKVNPHIMSIKKPQKPYFYATLHGHKILCLHCGDRPYVIVCQYTFQCFPDMGVGSVQNCIDRSLRIRTKALDHPEKNKIILYLKNNGYLQGQGSEGNVPMISVDDARRVYHFLYKIKNCSSAKCILELTAVPVDFNAILPKTKRNIFMKIKKEKVDRDYEKTMSHAPNAKAQGKRKVNIKKEVKDGNDSDNTEEYGENDRGNLNEFDQPEPLRGEHFICWNSEANTLHEAMCINTPLGKIRSYKYKGENFLAVADCCGIMGKEDFYTLIELDNKVLYSCDEQIRSVLNDINPSFPHIMSGEKCLVKEKDVGIIESEPEGIDDSQARKRKVKQEVEDEECSSPKKSKGDRLTVYEVVVSNPLANNLPLSTVPTNTVDDKSSMQQQLLSTQNTFLGKVRRSSSTSTVEYNDNATLDQSINDIVLEPSPLRSTKNNVLSESANGKTVQDNFLLDQNEDTPGTPASKGLVNTHESTEILDNDDIVFISEEFKGGRKPQLLQAKEEPVEENQPSEPEPSEASRPDAYQVSGLKLGKILRDVHKTRVPSLKSSKTNSDIPDNFLGKQDFVSPWQVSSDAPDSEAEALISRSDSRDSGDFLQHSIQGKARSCNKNQSQTSVHRQQEYTEVLKGPPKGASDNSSIILIDGFKATVVTKTEPVDVDQSLVVATPSKAWQLQDCQGPSRCQDDIDVNSLRECTGNSSKSAILKDNAKLREETRSLTETMHLMKKELGTAKKEIHTLYKLKTYYEGVIGEITQRFKNGDANTGEEETPIEID